MQIFWDGLLVASAATGKTRPLQPGGALMLGAEQDCYGGCTDRSGGGDAVLAFGLGHAACTWLDYQRDTAGADLARLQRAALLL